MASFFLDFGTTTAQALTGTEAGFVTQNGSIGVIGAPAVTMTGDTNLTVLGALGHHTDTSVVDGRGGFITVVVGETGFVGNTGSGAITMITDGHFRLDNLGTIRGEGIGVFMNASGDGATIHNSGSILGSSFGLFGGLNTTLVRLKNTGEISGGELQGILLSDGALRLNNAGIIQGGDGIAIDLAFDASRIINTGKILGDVSMSSESDLFRGAHGLLFGTLIAGAGNDTVSTGDEDDEVLGQGGFDALRTGAGEDTLVGGLNKDFLKGGADEDRFEFNAVEESVVGNADIIADFNAGTAATFFDRIDLSSIDAKLDVSGNQAFTFIGTAAYTGVSGQLRVTQSDGTTRIMGDVNGNQTTDLQIFITGPINLANLTALDFVL